MMHASAKSPSWIKLGLCLLYEALVVIALAFVAACLFYGFFGNATEGFKRFLLQLLIWLVIGVYFVWSWTKKGQTLAMQSWKVKLVRLNQLNDSVALLSFKQAITRYVLATLSFCMFGLGFLWAVFDPQKTFFHDRLLKTRIIDVQRCTSSPSPPAEKVV